MKTVGQLINELQALDPSTPVLQAKDEEGNDFHFVHEVAVHYIDKTDLEVWSVESLYDADELESDGEDLTDFAQVAVIWP